MIYARAVRPQQRSEYHRKNPYLLRSTVCASFCFVCSLTPMFFVVRSHVSRISFFFCDILLTHSCRVACTLSYGSPRLRSRGGQVNCSPAFAFEAASFIVASFV